MAGLQRSAVSFRRQGSSGLIWDDRFLSGELNRFPEAKPPSSAVDQIQTTETDPSKCSETSIRSINTVRRSRSNNGKTLTATEPSSPRIPVCGLCSAFGKPNKTHTRNVSRKRSFA